MVKSTPLSTSQKESSSDMAQSLGMQVLVKCEGCGQTVCRTQLTGLNDRESRAAALELSNLWRAHLATRHRPDHPLPAGPGHLMIELSARGFSAERMMHSLLGQAG